jgi:hypothetical protein
MAKRRVALRNSSAVSVCYDAESRRVSTSQNISTELRFKIEPVLRSVIIQSSTLKHRTFELFNQILFQRLCVFEASSFLIAKMSDQRPTRPTGISCILSLLCLNAVYLQSYLVNT